jgi:putative iron-regulated protein
MIKNIIPIAIIGLLSFNLSSCTDENKDPVAEMKNEIAKSFDQQTASNSAAIIVKTYQDFDDKAQILLNKVQAVVLGNQASIDEAKQAWKETRSPWEKSEGFLYGPTKTLNLDPAMDTWPVDVTAMNKIITSGQAITPAVIEANTETRGFHLIEFLIWGENSDKTAAQMTARELEYLKAAAQDLKNNTAKLLSEWTKYAVNFTNAGAANAKYTAFKGVYEELVGGMVTIANEVSTGKIEKPLNGNSGSFKLDAEESRFSNNSKADFADNIRSIQNIYLGTYNTAQANSYSVSALVKSKNAALDTEIQNKIKASIKAIEDIPGSFTQAIQSNRKAVSDAQTQVAELQTLLDSKLMALVKTL